MFALSLSSALLALPLSAQELGKLVPTDPMVAEIGAFGFHAALDGSRLVVGAPDTRATAQFAPGRAYVFERRHGLDAAQHGCTACPCGNNAPSGTTGGCLNSSASSAHLLAPETLRCEIRDTIPASFGVLVSGNLVAPASAGIPCSGLASGVTSQALNGLRCAVKLNLRHGGRATADDGSIGVATAGWGPPNNPTQGLGGALFAAGVTRHFQGFYREPPAVLCGREQNTTQAVTLAFVP